MGSKGEKHLLRLAAPKTWSIKKKGIKYVIRPKPGMHDFRLGLPLNILLKDILKYVTTSNEVKKALANQEILIDGKRRKDPSFIVGFMDTLSIPKLKEYYRILINKKGLLIPVRIDEKESKAKLCKLENKTPIKKQIQLNLSDGRNILVEKTGNNVGDTIIIEVPSQKIIDSLKFEKGAIICLFAGKHIGYVGKIEDIKEDKIIFKTKSGENVETLKKYAFIIGKGKSLIKLIENEQ